MKPKILKIYWATWRELRRLVPGVRGETMANYMERVKSQIQREEKK